MNKQDRSDNGIPPAIQAASPAKEMQHSHASKKHLTLKQKLLNCCPESFNELLYGAITLTAGLVGVINFMHTGETTTVMAVCYLVAGRPAVEKIQSLFLQKRRESVEQGQEQ